MGTVSFGATLLLALAAAGDGPADPPAATVHGKPLPRAAFHEALARRFLRGDAGEMLLEKMLMDLAARREQARRGITVSDAAVARSVEDTRRRLAEQMARSGMRAPPDALEASLKEAGSDLSEFVE